MKLKKWRCWRTSPSAAHAQYSVGPNFTAQLGDQLCWRSLYVPYSYCSSILIVRPFLLFVHSYFSSILIVRPVLLFIHSYCSSIRIVRPFLLFVHIFLTLSMYSYSCLWILIVRPCILNLVYVFLLLSMYTYCSSMYS